ncbi:MAG: hypothetical protein GC190_19280 [Alphaproteobacteria bacterium]|nr:hypothetical protein [Alphaproteobacteria bacterium]
MDWLEQIVSGMGASAPFAALALFMIRYLIKKVDEKDTALTKANEQILQLAQEMLKTAQEQTEAIKRLHP